MGKEIGNSLSEICALLLGTHLSLNKLSITHCSQSEEERVMRFGFGLGNLERVYRSTGSL